jgi:hypothetical protein
LNAYAVTVDGVVVNAYSMEPEYVLAAGDSAVGVFCHEYGHALGLPDLYDTDATSMGLGAWSVMAGGSWNGTNGNSPAYLDAWSRVIGWVAHRGERSVSGASLPAAEGSSTAYRLWTNGAAGTEYFLLENRQRITGDFDNGLPGGGLLLYHIDENANQNTDWRPRVMVEQADAQWDLQYSANAGDAGTPPGTSQPGSRTSTVEPRSYVGVYLRHRRQREQLCADDFDLTVAMTPRTSRDAAGRAPLDVSPRTADPDVVVGGTPSLSAQSRRLRSGPRIGADSGEKGGYITASARPVADFTASPTAECAAGRRITDTSLCSTSWSWTFGMADLDDSTVVQVRGPRCEPDGIGAGGSDTKRSRLHRRHLVAAAPVASFSGVPQPGPAPLPVGFTGQSTRLSPVGRALATVPSQRRNPGTSIAPGSCDGAYISNASGSDTGAKADFVTVLPSCSGSSQVPQ